MHTRRAMCSLSDVAELKLHARPQRKSSPRNQRGNITACVSWARWQCGASTISECNREARAWGHSSDWLRPRRNFGSRRRASSRSVTWVFGHSNRVLLYIRSRLRIRSSFRLCSTRLWLAPAPADRDSQNAYLDPAGLHLKLRVALG